MDCCSYSPLCGSCLRSSEENNSSRLFLLSTDSIHVPCTIIITVFFFRVSFTSIITSYCFGQAEWVTILHLEPDVHPLDPQIRSWKSFCYCQEDIKNTSQRQTASLMNAAFVLNSMCTAALQNSYLECHNNWRCVKTRRCAFSCLQKNATEKTEVKIVQLNFVISCKLKLGNCQCSCFIQ